MQPQQEPYLEGFNLLLLAQILLLGKLEPPHSLALIRHLLLHGFDLSLDFRRSFLFVFDLLEVSSATQHIVNGICSNASLSARCNRPVAVKAGNLSVRESK